MALSGVEQQPAFRTARTFNAKHALVIGLVLIIVGCFSILFNVVDLTIGTGISADPPRYTITGNDRTLSRTSLGVIGHGIWSGIVVSINTESPLLFYF